MKKNYTLFVGLIIVHLAWWSPIQAKNANDVAFSLFCPDDVTVDCNAELWDLSGYGNATYHDYSGYHSAGTPVVHYYLNSCGGGYITRTWTVEDAYWNTQSCTQTITVGFGAGFNGNSIQWPQMVTLEGCEPNTHPDITGKPTWVPSECSMIGYSYKDQLFTISPDCKKILRKWTVIDWCTNENSYNNQGSWTYTQTIKIVVNAPPAFDCIKDITVSAFDCKNGKVVSPPLTIPSSSCGGNYEITNNSIYATEKKADISGIYPVGTTKVTLTIKYGCGQKVTCLVNVTVKNDKAPVPVCINNLSVALMGQDTNQDGINDQGMVQLWAKDLDWKSFSTCNNYPLRFSFSPTANEMSKVFTCDNVGKSKVKMYVIDSKGNQSYCEVELDVQNNAANIENCKPQTTTPQNRKYSAKGSVKDIYDAGLKNVSMQLYDPTKLYEIKTIYDTTKVVVKDSFKNLSGYWVFYHDEKLTITSHKDTIPLTNGLAKVITDDKGIFSFDTLMEKQKTYMVKCPEYDGGALTNIDKADLDMLTLYLLGQKPFTHAWQYLAADVDRNGKINIEDLNLMIKYLKGEVDHFADKQHYLVFMDNVTDKMNEVILLNKRNWLNLDSVKTDVTDIHFMAIQLGDLSKEKATGIINNEDIDANLRSIEVSINEGLSIFPNPFSNELIIRFESSEDKSANFGLYDWSGKLIHTAGLRLQKGSNEFNYNNPSLPSGIYLYRLDVGDKQFTGKVVRE